MENPTVPPHPNNVGAIAMGTAIGNFIGSLYKLMSSLVNPVRIYALAFSFVYFLVWVVFSSKHPQFRVDSFSLSNFTLIGNSSSSSAISVAAQVQLTARNPNKFVALSFGRTDANVFCSRSSWSLGPTVLPPFSLGKKSQAPLTASFAAVLENGNGTDFDLNLVLLSSVRYKERVVGSRRNHVLTVFCEGLVVGIPSDHNGRKPGGLIDGAPRLCQVNISSS